MHALGFMQTTT